MSDRSAPGDAVTCPADTEAPRDVRVIEGRRARVGNGEVLRVLPTKGRRTVGPWCFLDTSEPGDHLDADPMEVGPHPHIGLSTVTWMLEGQALHTDSLGTHQVIRAQQLNLMSAGNGIAHAELGRPEPTRLVQLWLAQPEHARHGAPRFQHVPDLPVVDLGAHGPGGEAVVLIGALDGVAAPTHQDHPTTGAELRLRPGATRVPVDTAHEHGVVPLDGPVLVGGTRVDVGAIALIPFGAHELVIEAPSSLPVSRVMLLGGEPLGETIAMWWNFVARDRDELVQAWRDWQADDTDRFGTVESVLDRIDAPRPTWLGTDP